MESVESFLKEYFDQVNIPYTEIPRSKVKNKKTPDFQICVFDKKVIIETKEFECGKSDVPFSRGRGFFTAPQPPGMNKIREKLRECSDQFKECGNEITLCVLCNARGILIDLDTQIVGMAMFGDIQICLSARNDHPVRFEYGRNGVSQISRKENGSLISAVAILETYPNQKEFYWRLRIIHNPYARIPLPIKIFNGRFDEEWIYEDNSFIRR